MSDWLALALSLVVVFVLGAGWIQEATRRRIAERYLGERYWSLDR
jgi:hypothetical protein